MKDVRFYEEYDSPKDKRTRKGNGNVLAVDVANAPAYDGSREAIGAVFFCPDSPVASASAGREHLSQRCRRISEVRAREIHPALFVRLDAAD